MCEIATKDFFHPSFPVVISKFEQEKGSYVPTYFLMKELMEKHKDEMELYFIIGTDLLPTLKSWDEGEKLLEEVKFILLKRRGYENVDTD